MEYGGDRNTLRLQGNGREDLRIYGGYKVEEKVAKILIPWLSLIALVEILKEEEIKAAG